ncbi:MAG: hypothetical protein B6242_09425 [Anaerolineaceae bacterium 4572_78]|nr:MAG: hypothetical protein B6242_09425 [Anaerolineaceae bacterium 4572_78]
MSFELHAEKRHAFGKKTKALRQKGYVPAEIYGKGQKNISIQVEYKHLEKILKSAGGTNLIEINIDDSEPVVTLARSRQYSPVKRKLLHVDFHNISTTDKVSVRVPIELIGTSVLIQEGGVLMRGITHIDVEVEPNNIPKKILFDTSVISTFAKSATVSSLSLPEGVTVLSNPTSMIANILPPRLITEEVEVTEETVVEEEEEKVYEE